MTLQPLLAGRLFDLLSESARENHRVLTNLCAQFQSNSDPRKPMPTQCVCGEGKFRETCDRLARTPVAGLEPEEIAGLAFTLSEVSHCAKRLAERLPVCPVPPCSLGLGRQAECLERSALVLLDMVAHLRDGLHLGTFQELHARLLGYLEEAEDRLDASRAAVIAPGSGELQVVALDSIYRCLDELMDALQEAGSMLHRVCLANN